MLKGVSELIEEVRASPGDDEPRLAFATAVEATDPRRAKLIRLSCELARTPPTDPRHAAVEAELARCTPLDEHHADLAAIRGLVWGYERGFVGFLRARADVLAREAETFRRHPIESLVVELKAREVADLLACGVLGSVRSLTLVGPSRATLEVLASGALPHLRKLAIETDDTLLAKLADLPAMAALESLALQLGGDTSHAMGVLASADGLQRLRHLELRTASGPVPLDSSTVVGAAAFRGLQSLELGSLDDPAGANALESLDDLRSLIVWDLGDDAGPILCAGPVVERLNRLKLHDASRAAVLALAANPGSSSLRRLELGGLLQTVDIVGDDGVAALACSPHLVGLEALELSGCSMGHRGAEALADAEAFPQLRELNLQLKNELGAAGIRALARWSSLAGVHTLYLPLQEPEPATVLAPLLDSGTLRSVRRLDLWGPREAEGDAVIAALARADLPVLSHLAMAHGPSFGAKGARVLLGSHGLPALAILWARLAKVPKAARTALRERFLVFDSQADTGLDSPLALYRS